MELRLNVVSDVALPVGDRVMLLKEGVRVLNESIHRINDSP